ncbi:MAG: DUF3516 domain-containing protein [bacterium]|nr:DUF3516 domain-containing protein [bacterium]
MAEAAAAETGLMDRITRIGGMSPDQILDAFLDWVIEQGLEPYPAQESAFLEIMAGRHLILNTPTGSGKSLVAQAVHFKGLCEGKRSFYTSPTKALASEKFFALCRDFGAENVGMLTGDASINSAAPVICCTAEVLANMALRQGAQLQAPYVIMDEFHYYADPHRGAAWQIPLLCLPDTHFLLMSATLGEMSQIREDLERRTGVEVARIDSSERPVPLDYAYCETPLQETIEGLLESGKFPVYVVNFTQRECAELAQGLTSLKICTKEEKALIREQIDSFAFDTSYGKDMRRFLQSGIGIHHAGLLPRYRLLVEQLSQSGLLKVICGTDTLGVGVNIPIRTVVFSKLSKFDGRRAGILRVREFKQISGRAGRKGYDDLGSVVCQAPAHLIEAQRQRRKGKKKSSPAKAPRGFVAWNRGTFQSLIDRDPEPLRSNFRLSHSTLVSLFRREEESSDPSSSYRVLIELIDSTHETASRKHALRRSAAALFRSIRSAGIVQIIVDDDTGQRRLRVNEDLQWDFSMHHSLSLFVVDAINAIEAETPEEYALEVMSLVEAILENPNAILYAQMDRIKRDLMAQLKAERVPFEERVRLLDEVEPPQPSREFIYQNFDYFAEKHRWVGHDDVRPKSIAREIYEGYFSFSYYTTYYGLQRIEGLLLRYLTQVYNTLSQTVPEVSKTQEVWDMLAFFRTMIERIDSSLMSEWQNLIDPGSATPASSEQPARQEYDLAKDARALKARIRAELHQCVRALAERDWEEAALVIRSPDDEPWDGPRMSRTLAPFYEEYDQIVFDQRARLSEFTLIRDDGPRRWQVTQRLLDPEGDNFWCLEGEVDLSGESTPEGPIVCLTRIGT